MKTKVSLHAAEVFFLGKAMEAKYIDYTYIALMPDIQRRYKIHEQQAMESLEEKELLEEDFSGNIEVSEEAEDLFTPVFFGEFEAVLNNGTTYRIHRQKKQMTLGVIEGEEIHFSEMDASDLETLLQGEVHLQCSDVQKGFSEMNFSKAQLQNEAVRKQILSMIKGDQ